MVSERYFPKKISEARMSEGKICVVGIVDDPREDGFVIRDGNEKIHIEFVGSPQKNKFVRVFCTVNDGKVRADIVQNLNGADVQLFKKVEELYSKAGV